MKYKTNNAKETQNIAKGLAEEVLKNNKKSLSTDKGAFVIALKGDLGGGKTTFIQGFAKGIGVKEKITSPTFNIYKNYKLKTNNYKLFYHFDCYRIENPKEILDLEFKKIIFDSKNIVVIEWPEKIKAVLPKNALWIKFKFINKTNRSINFLARKD